MVPHLTPLKQTTEPENNSCTHSQTTTKTPLTIYIIVALFLGLSAGFTLTLAIRDISFWTNDEARYAQGGREQLENGFSSRIMISMVRAAL